MMRNDLLFFLAVLLLTGCSDAVSDETASESVPAVRVVGDEPADDGASKLHADRPQAVEISPASRAYLSVTTVEPKSVESTVSAPARVEFRGKALSTVGAVVAGRLGKINVQVGDRVKPGDALAILESPQAAQMRSDVERTRAELGRANDRAKRQAIMQQKGVGLEIERVEAETQLRQARSDFERSLQAARLLGEGSGQVVVLRAESDGVVLRVDATIGAAVEAGAVLFEMGEPKALWVVADVFENDLPLIKEGAKATIQTSVQTATMTGHVARVSASMQTESRRGSVYIELDDANVALKPGMFARATIEAAGPERIVLPTTAVLIKDNKQTVVYLETSDGRFEPRPVVVGQARDGYVPVIEGLSSGDRVVSAGALLLDSAAAQLQ